MPTIITPREVTSSVVAPPAATLTLSVEGSPVASSWNVLATSTISGLTQVQWYMDTVYAGTVSTPPFRLTVNPASYGAGSHTVIALGLNAASSTLTTARVDVWEGGPPTTPTLSPLFPVTAIWNQPCDTAPLHANNAIWMDVNNGHTGHNLHPEWVPPVYQGRFLNIPVNLLSSSGMTPRTVTVTAYASESDPIPGGVLPIPPSVLIEGDPGAFDPAGDNHLLWVDTATNRLHEFFGTQRSGSNYIAKQYSTWDLASNALRTAGWTSADAAGLPMSQLMIRYDEANYALWSGGTIPHALRFTLSLVHGPYLWPARHDANTGGVLNPPLGMRVRLKAGFDISSFSPMNQAILRTLKKYGMYLTDTGGDWFMQGDYDPRWNEADINNLKSIVPLGKFEVVDDSGRQVSANSAETVGLSLTDAGTGLTRVVSVTAAGQFRLTFEAADNWGLSQWYDLVNDPSAATNLVGPALPVGGDPTVAEPGLFQMVFYGLVPDDCKAYTRSALYYFPGSARTFSILENTAARVIVQATSHPMVTAVGVLTDVTNTVTSYIYPNGKIYISSVTSSIVGQSSSGIFCGVMGLDDPTQTGTVPPDTRGWVRASATQNPYSFVGSTEPYVFAYWHPSTPAPYTTWTKASVLLVPKAGNPQQASQIIHSWTGHVRWGYGSGAFAIPPNSSLTQEYLIQLGSQGSTVLPNITTSAVAGPIATAYLANPTPP